VRRKLTDRACCTTLRAREVMGTGVGVVAWMPRSMLCGPAHAWELWSAALLWRSEPDGTSRAPAHHPNHEGLRRPDATPSSKRRASGRRRARARARQPGSLPAGPAQSHKPRGRRAQRATERAMHAGSPGAQLVRGLRAFVHAESAKSAASIDPTGDPAGSASTGPASADTGRFVARASDAGHNVTANVGAGFPVTLRPVCGRIVTSIRAAPMRVTLWKAPG
jgi:hypothetical protein